MKSKLIQFNIIVLIMALQLLSCRGKKQMTSFDQEVGNISQPLADSLKEIGAGNQKTEIDPTKDVTVVGKYGTVIFISANSLLGENGVAITAKAIIQLKEYYSLTDIVTGNLQTIHNDDILQTQGMIYLQAYSLDGTPIKIDKSKPIRVEMPSDSFFISPLFFKGTRDETGNINWVTIEEQAKKLVPFPIKMVAPVGDGECPKDFGITKDPEIWKNERAKNRYTNDEIIKYENTLLATREFKERFYCYCEPELTKIYINNLGKNLWEIDDMAVRFFIRDSIERVGYEINTVPPGPNGGARTKMQEEAREWLINRAKEEGHQLITIFKTFASQKLTKVDETKRIDTSKVRGFDKIFASYDALEFGWINCDFFYKDPKAENIKLFVQISDAPAIVNIIFKGKKVILNGNEVERNRFKFTKDKEGYTKLPKGDTATILAIGYRDKLVTFGSKEIVIGLNETEVLDLKPITTAELTARLK